MIMVEASSKSSTLACNGILCILLRGLTKACWFDSTIIMFMVCGCKRGLTLLTGETDRPWMGLIPPALALISLAFGCLFVVSLPPPLFNCILY